MHRSFRLGSYWTCSAVICSSFPRVCVRFTALWYFPPTDDRRTCLTDVIHFTVSRLFAYISNCSLPFLPSTVHNGKLDLSMCAVCQVKSDCRWMLTGWCLLLELLLLIVIFFLFGFSMSVTTTKKQQLAGPDFKFKKLRSDLYSTNQHPIRRNCFCRFGSSWTKALKILERFSFWPSNQFKKKMSFFAFQV